MARLFVLNQIIQEAHAVDLYAIRNQASGIRKMNIFTLDKDYVLNYRLSEELITQVLEDIKPLLKPIKRRRRELLSDKVKLLCTLSFLSNGSYQRVCGRNITNFVSQPSMSRSIHEVVEALNHPTIVKKYIRFPQNPQERLKLKERFYEKYNVPGVIGCIDWTYVSMVRPAENEERFYCRKGYHARNVQLITDADLNILHVDATYGGATHDSFIFNNGIIQEHLEALTNADEMVHLLGDSGYSQRAYLMVPVPGTEEGIPAQYYNNLHATARNSVERTIGLLKTRFRCLLVHRVLHYHPDMVTKIVIACCVLHNICNRAGLAAPTMDTYNQQREIQFHAGMVSHDRDTASHEANLGQIRRQHLINILWRTRNVNLIS